MLELTKIASSFLLFFNIYPFLVNNQPVFNSGQCNSNSHYFIGLNRYLYLYNQKALLS